eukprot:PhM_4_TR8096/c0_g1_i1/m.60458
MSTFDQSLARLARNDPTLHALSVPPTVNSNVFIALLRRNNNLKHLSLAETRGRDFDEDKVCALAQTLPLVTSLRSLDLSHVNLTPDGVNLLCTGYLSTASSSLQRLDISNNALTPLCFQRIAEVLSSPVDTSSLSPPFTLIMRECSGYDSGLESFFRVLLNRGAQQQQQRRRRRLSYLDVRHNGASSRVMSLLSDVVELPDSFITAVEIAGNAVDVDTSDRIYKALRENARRAALEAQKEHARAVSPQLNTLASLVVATNASNSGKDAATRSSDSANDAVVKPPVSCLSLMVEVLKSEGGAVLA